MAERDLSRPGGWSFRTEAPVSRPLDYVVQVGVAAGDSPVELNLVFTDDGLYVPAIVRKPPGRGPFPAVICMHGGTGGLGISYLVDQVLNRGFVFDRLLEEGYVVVFTEGRMEIEWAYGTDIPASLDHNDLIATFRYMQRQSYVDPGRVAFFGISHGGKLQMKLISEIQEGPAALVPASRPWSSIWPYNMTARGRKRASNTTIRCPIPSSIWKWPGRESSGFRLRYPSWSWEGIPIICRGFSTNCMNCSIGREGMPVGHLGPP
jgi:hypothetical protein